MGADWSNKLSCKTRRVVQLLRAMRGMPEEWDEDGPLPGPASGKVGASGKGKKSATKAASAAEKAALAKQTKEEREALRVRSPPTRPVSLCLGVAPVAPVAPFSWSFGPGFAHRWHVGAVAQPGLAAPCFCPGRLAPDAGIGRRCTRVHCRAPPSACSPDPSQCGFHTSLAVYRCARRWMRTASPTRTVRWPRRLRRCPPCRSGWTRATACARPPPEDSKRPCFQTLLSCQETVLKSLSAFEGAC